MRRFNSIRRSGRSVTETTSSLVIPVTHFNKNEYVYKPINHITQKQHLITWLCTPLLLIHICLAWSIFRKTLGNSKIIMEPLVAIMHFAALNEFSNTLSSLLNSSK